MKHTLLYFVACCLLLFSCNKIPDHAKYIPKDAQLVATIDLNQMGKKLIWNALTGSELFKEMQKNMSNEDSKNAMKDISNIGLNQHSTVYFCLSANHRKDGTASIIVGMSDKDAFEAFLKKTYPNIVIDKGNGFSSTLIENKILAAWNRDAAIFYPMGSDTSITTMTFSFHLNDAGLIRSKLEETFSRPAATSILSNAHFKSLQKEGHDISIWLNYEELYNNNADASTNPFIKQDYFKDAGLATGIDFEKGKAAAVMDYYMSKDMADIYKKYEPHSLDLDLIRKIPSTDIDLIAGYNMNPLMIQEYLKKFGLDGLLNMGLGLAGTSMDNIASTFKGDMVFAISDMNMKSGTDTVNYDENADRSPDMKMTMAMSIKDQTGLEKLLGIGVKNNMLTKNGNIYSWPDTGSKAALMYDKNTMVYSSDATMANAYLAGKGNTKASIPADVWKHFSSSPMVFYVDMKKVMQSIPAKTHQNNDEEFMTEAKKFFNYIEFHGGTMKNDAVHVEGAMMLSNESENALIQLLDLGMKAKKMNDANEAEFEKADSTLIQ